MIFYYFPSVKCLNYFVDDIVCDGENLHETGNVHDNDFNEDIFEIDNDGGNDVIVKMVIMVRIMMVMKMIMNLIMFMKVRTIMVRYNYEEIFLVLLGSCSQSMGPLICISLCIFIYIKRTYIEMDKNPCFCIYSFYMQKLHLSCHI